jgi:hypothetical protein
VSEILARIEERIIAVLIWTIHTRALQSYRLGKNSLEVNRSQLPDFLLVKERRSGSVSNVQQKLVITRRGFTRIQVKNNVGFFTRERADRGNIPSTAKNVIERLVVIFPNKFNVFERSRFKGADLQIFELAFSDSSGRKANSTKVIKSFKIKVDDLQMEGVLTTFGDWPINQPIAVVPRIIPVGQLVEGIFHVNWSIPNGKRDRKGTLWS